MQAQRSYHKKVLASANRPIPTSDKPGDGVEQTGVHKDQVVFVEKLKLIKRLMLKVKLHYRGEPMTLWDYAGMSSPDQAGPYMSERVIFDDKVRQGRLLALIEALTDCEIYISQIFEELDLKASIRRWFNLKIFGTFEQLRTEMELRFP